MQKNLVIVESPAKAKTIEKFLGKDYKVMSSYGHIRDLKTKEFSIDLAHNYAPQYVIPAEKKKLVTELKGAAKEAEQVWLASDEDREGEAIAWHLYEVLGLKPENTRRIVFHEITKNAILHAIETPRGIDINLVNAQQARRVLDRIVGFELSPVLWRRVKPALSAGRVQSVAVRLIVEREREINDFVPEAAYRVVATFVLPDGTTLLKAELNRRLKDEKEARAFLEACDKATFTIDEITKKPVRKSPAPPFTTSTLQQEAARKLGYSVSQTMMLAQRLYESGLITYMRTDSVNLSDLALGTAKECIVETYGERYYKFRKYHTKSKGAQEAHEAIRPTYMNRESVTGTAQEKKLYELIRKRTIACQMADAELERTTISVAIGGRKEKFVATGEVLTFDGFLQVYRESSDDENEKEQENGLLPPVAKDEALTLKDAVATERFTQRPPRYTEASLVRRLEELGIGRPSTYAPTIQTIQNRQYVVKGDKEGEERAYTVITLAKGKIKEARKSEVVGTDRNKLMPTDIGIVVNDFLMEYFPGVMDYNFTASVEKEFDTVAEGKMVWTDAIDKFYKIFHPIVEAATSVRMEHKVGERELGIDPKSGKPVFVKIGRYGPVVQIGVARTDDGKEEEAKPRFATLMKGQSIETITLEEALRLFDLPRTIGEYNGKEMVAAVGRFGPFIRYEGKFVSIPKTLNPLTITSEEAIELIEEKKRKDEQRFVKKFAEEPELEILQGRFGPYISYKGKNHRIPKTVEKPEALTLEECRAIIAEADKAAPKKRVVKKKEK
ncbi:MAG TPA: type I DNA topoisomerase [Candidatus Parabacteroides intestinigallinarum]|uniref:DNA topoisomerase 1 n=1 Tax=Candidatus Parabacteroides intestinigallinarum TaxID=2838722 RepID=A0A9D1XTA2_9BACT|nr:type I DNA topoisomerase [Candidatus Parabacteroides intestinigallinarum]